ncbi:MAG: hypothetical protein ABSH05_03295 [Bryobacteraceae bacterium]
MADFRKLFLALAVMALLVVPAFSADQPTVTCSASSSPVIIRDGGLTEIVGDVTLSCDNTAVGAVDVQTDIQIFMNYAQVTNKVLNNTGAGGECPTGIKCVTDAVAVAKWISIAAPSAPGVAGNPTPIIGLLQSRLDLTGDPANQRNSILFPRVPVPAGTITYIRISNVRIAAPSVSASGSTDVFEKITTNNVVITPNYQLPVATVQIPLQFQAMGCDGSTPVSLSFQQCNQVNPDTSNMNYTNGNFNVQFIEGFALAFKPVSNATSVIVGNKFQSESGYYFASLTSPGGSTVTDVGLASTGTNLVLRFTNIPSGINIYVTKSNVFKGTSQLTTTGPPAITAVAAGTATGTMSCNGKAYDQNQPAIPVTISGGAGSVSWVVTSIDSTFNYQKTIAFGVSVSYVPNTSLDLPGLTGTPGGGVTGALGPLSTIDYAVPIASTAPIPRFRDNPKGATVFSVNPCITNILFPYVTVKAGFDTGVALINTSLDTPVIGTQTQHGACTMYYFDATTAPPAAQNTCDIKPGGMVAFSMMSSGGIPSATCADGSVVTNTTVPIGWQGYAIAKCRFQFGHGYAFISDRNVPGLGSQGYLALILPAGYCTRGPNPFSSCGTGAGEMLVH